MASFFSSLRSVVSHPVTTLAAFVSGIGSVGAMAVSVQAAIGQASSLHGVSPALLHEFSDLQLGLGSLAAISFVLVSLGESFFKAFAVEPPQPDKDPANLLPFYSRASSVPATAQVTSVSDRKAA